jgi:carboxymethylenebutenolidase
MPVTTRYESVASHDGDTFDIFCAIPETGSGPVIVLFQEIFGINDNMRGLAERVAEAGYVGVVPDMFWRVERRFERKDESGIGDAFAVVGRFDAEKGIADLQSVHAHVLAMTESTGKVGGVGFCFGGGMAFAFGASSRVNGGAPDAVVPYYGSAVNQMLGMLPGLTCPTMFHYGNTDAFIPESAIAEVEQAVQAMHNVAFYRYDAGHAFSNWDAPSMYQKDAADLAWSRTMTFFDQHLH